LVQVSKRTQTIKRENCASFSDLYYKHYVIQRLTAIYVHKRE